MAHVREAVVRQPWVLVAYAWVMYMAVFSGGRWIRGQLVEAGREFWKGGGVVEGMDGGNGGTGELCEGGGVLERREWERFGLSFFYFDGEEDGEDIKAEFKRRLGDADALLTAEQRRDVVEEAKEIFSRSVLLVEELDELLATPLVSTRTKSQPEKPAKVGKVKNEAETTLSLPVVTRRIRWINSPGIAGLAVVLSCVSWYAFSHAGIWG